MTRVRFPPEPVLAADGSVAAVLRDEVLIRIDVTTGHVRSRLVPFAARSAAVGPTGRLIAVAGDGRIAVYDATSDQPVWQHAIDLIEVSRVAIDLGGTVAVSSARERNALLVTATGVQGSAPLPDGFHEWLLLLPRHDARPVAHLGLSEGDSPGWLLYFDGTAPSEMTSPPGVRGALVAGSMLGLYSTHEIRLYDLDPTGPHTIAVHPVDDIERAVASPAGTWIVTKSVQWDGTTDVLTLNALDLTDGAWHHCPTGDLEPDDIFVVDDNARIVSAAGRTSPARVIIRGISAITPAPEFAATHEIDIDTEVQSRRP